MDKAEQRDRLGQLFAALTARFEDAATLAAEGQGSRQLRDRLRSIASALDGQIAEAQALCEQIAALTRRI